MRPAPRQTRSPSGSLIVRFHAADGTETAWHLYPCGDTAEVIEPDELREMVEGHRRDDTLRYRFPAHRYKRSDSAPILCRFSSHCWHRGEPHALRRILNSEDSRDEDT